MSWISRYLDNVLNANLIFHPGSITMPGINFIGLDSQRSRLDGRVSTLRPALYQTVAGFPWFTKKPRRSEHCISRLPASYVLERHKIINFKYLHNYLSSFYILKRSCCQNYFESIFSDTFSLRNWLLKWIVLLKQNLGAPPLGISRIMKHLSHNSQNTFYWLPFNFVSKLFFKFKL